MKTKFWHKWRDCHVNGGYRPWYMILWACFWAPLLLLGVAIVLFSVFMVKGSKEVKYWWEEFF